MPTQTIRLMHHQIPFVDACLYYPSCSPSRQDLLPSPDTPQRRANRLQEAIVDIVNRAGYKTVPVGFVWLAQEHLSSWQRVEIPQSLNMAVHLRQPFEFDIITDRFNQIVSLSEARPMTQSIRQASLQAESRNQHAHQMVERKSRAWIADTLFNALAIFADPKPKAIERERTSIAPSPSKRPVAQLEDSPSICISEDGGKSWFVVESMATKHS